MQKFLKFPDGFKWGSATSSHQVEGNTHNDWSEWEQSPARIAQLKKEGKSPKDFISGRGADQYHLYEKDFDIAKELGHTIHRLSIEWSRIEPEQGKFDEKELQHYRDVIDALRRRGIEPMVTLWHFTNPVWFAKKGGFLHPDAPELYKRFISKVVDNLKDRVGLWITFNEADDVYAAMAYYRGEWPPQKKSIFLSIKFTLNIIRAHKLAYREIRKIYSSSHVSQDQEILSSMSHNVNMPQIGIVENNRHFITGNFLGRLQQRILEYFRNRFLLDRVSSSLDFIGLNYYTIERFLGSYSVLPQQSVMKEMDWEIYPPGLYHELMELRRYHKPVFITENGIADGTDMQRGSYVRDHLRYVWQAIQDGVDVQGYLYWSLIDNFEWARGFGPRFGLVEVDYDTLERKIRPSAREYATIIESNGLSADV
jgi:beta-glucosidase